MTADQERKTKLTLNPLALLSWTLEPLRSAGCHWEFTHFSVPFEVTEGTVVLMSKYIEAFIGL